MSRPWCRFHLFWNEYLLFIPVPHIRVRRENIPYAIVKDGVGVDAQMTGSILYQRWALYQFNGCI